MRIDLLLRWTPTAVFSIMLWYSWDFWLPSGCNKSSLIMCHHQLKFVAALFFPALLLFFYLVEDYLWDSNPIDWLENLCSKHFQVFFIWKCITRWIGFLWPFSFQGIDSEHWDCPSHKLTLTCQGIEHASDQLWSVCFINTGTVVCKHLLHGRINNL